MSKRLAAPLLMIGILTMVPTTPALAKIVHDEVGHFNLASALPTGIAVDNSSHASRGDLYVAVVNSETFASTIVKLDASGTVQCVITGTATPAANECNGAAGSQTPQGSFGLVTFSPSFALSGVTVDSSSGANQGDLYVADVQNDVVDKFTEGGEFVCQITGAATPSSKECNGAAGSDTSAGGFAPTALAVNAAGDLFVADLAHNLIDEFGPKGEYITSIESNEPSGPRISEPTALTIGAGGALYIVNGGATFPGRELLEFSGGKFTIAQSSEPRGIAVEPATGRLLVQNNNSAGGVPGRIDEYQPSGGLASTFGASREVGTLAVSATSGEIYDAVVTSGEVAIFSADIVIPTVSVSPAANVEETTATLQGEVSPDTADGGTEATECGFEYVTQAQFESEGFTGAAKVSCTPPPPYATASSVSANVTGLAANTTYYYRLVAANANGRLSYSENPAEETFLTKGPPTIEDESTSGLTRASATLEAKIDPKGFDTHYEFQYGETTAYGSGVPIPPGDIGSAQQAVSVAQALSGLKVGTTYHYRVVAVNSHGTVNGVDRSFATVPVAGIEYQLALTGPHAATVKANIDPKMGLPALKTDTTCELQYVSQARFEASGYAESATTLCTPASIEAASEGQNVIAKLSDLAENTVYRYRIKASNEAGEAALEETLTTFGFMPPFEARLLGAANAPFVQAGGHPFQLTTSILFGTTPYGGGFAPPSGTLKDVHVQLPPGLIGDPTATTRCTVRDAQFRECGTGAQVGVIVVTLENTGRGGGAHPHEDEEPIYNVVPPKGVAAEFASSNINGGLNATILAHVRTGEGYGVSADSLNVPILGAIKAVVVSLWGVPADPAHSSQRFCPEKQEVTGCESGEPLRPFLRTPTSCPGGKLTTTVTADAYQAPNEFVEARTEMPAMEGCAKLRFAPRISVTPESSSSSSPTGLHVDLHVPQEENPRSIAEADLKDAKVILPAGLNINPSSANGMVGCPLLTGKEEHPGVLGIDMEDAEPAKCPDASKVGSVEVVSPLVDHPLKGGVYVAQQGNAGPAQGSNPFGSLAAIYIAIDDPQTGVVIKLAGDVTIDAVTGQITTTFNENPQLPFEDLRLELFGGAHGALGTPSVCGTYKTTTMLEPWSHQGAPGETGTPDAERPSEFDITSGPGGAPCSSLGTFAPELIAGTQSNAAASFSPFAMNLTRKDGEQVFSAVALTMPLGLAGDVSAVTLCPETQANAGTCPSSSKIGHVRISAGVGNEPIVLPEKGKPEDPVYLTQSYKGAPFGLSVVVPAQAGPFDLDEGGHPIVVRAKIEINPSTAQVTVVSDPQPTRLQGIPLDVRDIEVIVDKPNFMFNPTSCSPMSVAGTIESAEGAASNVSSRFQAADCASLPFKPGFSALTNATHTRFGGDSLHVVVRSAQGQANLKEVHVELPKVLPSRLSTINQACPEKTFAANPAACPTGSRVGVVSVQTPILSVPIVGPAYFVSHGGAKFPELIFVLQGEGVTVQLNGETFISSKGITSSTFKTIPDVPVSSVDVVLPAGQDSVLTGEGDLCAHPLYIPTTLIGQNGAVVKQRTRIAVQGCKPELIVLRRKVTGATARITVKAPSAGRLTASGRFVSRAVARLRKAGVATVSVTLTKAEQRLLARHRGRKLKVHVELRLSATNGQVLTRSTTVLVA